MDEISLAVLAMVNGKLAWDAMNPIFAGELKARAGPLAQRTNDRANVARGGCTIGPRRFDLIHKIFLNKLRSGGLQLNDPVTVDKASGLRYLVGHEAR